MKIHDLDQYENSDSQEQYVAPVFWNMIWKPRAIRIR